MAYQTTDYTMMEALIDPQVLAAMVNPAMEGKFKFLDILDIDYTLQGRPGTTISVPQYEYIGAATVVPEADLIPIAKLVTSMVEFTIEKLGKGVILTDEDLLSAYGSPREQAVSQIATSIADAINDKVHAHLKAIGADMTVKYGLLNSDAVANALVLFGEDEDENDGDGAGKFMYVSPLELAELRKNAAFIPYTEAGVNAMRNAQLGTIWGVHIRVSNLLAENEVYIAKKGFVTAHMKRDTIIEVGRIQERASWLITGTKHAGTNVTHVSRGIKLEFDSTLIPTDTGK